MMKRTSLLIVISLLAGSVANVAQTRSAADHKSQLGNVVFPNSGSERVQPYFIRGVAALHSFWFEEALEAFQQATKLDPDFMMGYWGEAMSYNHPLWAEQQYDAGKQAVAKIKNVQSLTDKERGFLNAVKLLYGEGDKLTRDKAYCSAMEKMYRDAPDDLEVASFYALSLLGTVRPEDKGYRRQALAGAIALEVYRKNPNHPGAAHYIIHAFDDPERAILALPAAYRYAEIAPEAHHARHMPSHIFLQLGMWIEAARSNESSWATSDEWVKRKGLPISLRDYHSLHWLLYVYCQQGRYSKAADLLEVMRSAMANSKDEDKLRPNYYANNWATMAATFIVESGNGQLVDKLLPLGSETSDDASDHHGSMSGSAPASTVRQGTASKVRPVFVGGLASAIKGGPDAQTAIDFFKANGAGSANPAGNQARAMSIRLYEIEAALAAVKSNFDEAIALMKKATALEE